MPDTLHQSEALVQARIDIVALEKTVEGMGREIGEIKEAVAELTRTVNGMRDQLTEAKGGWKTLMLLGGASATFGGALAWLAEHLIKTP
jgi:hypothetical protein